MKNVYLYVALAICVAITATGLYSLGVYHKSSYNCVAGPNEVCGSDQFVEDRARVKEMDKEIAVMAHSKAIREWQDKIDLRNGIAERNNAQLNEAKKSGLDWDEAKQRFLKQDKPQVAQATPAPVTPEPAKPTPEPTPPAKK